MKHYVLPFLAIALTGACQSSPPEAVQTGKAPVEPAGPPKRLFGAPLGGAENVKLETVLTYPGRFAERSLIVEGYVRRACSKKGCWMELATSKDPRAPGCRVTFKDYGFFVPTDSAGATARLQGTAFLRRLDKKAVDHLEAEGATFASKTEDGTADEIRIEATGVELTRPAT